MSTKTNFKRVALVAVAALGLGVLTSVAPANAALGATSLTVTGGYGVCASDSAVGLTTIAMAKTGQLVISVNAAVDAGDTVKTSGSLYITSASQGTISVDQKKVTENGAGSAITFVPSGTGSATIWTQTAGAGANVQTVSVTILDSCAGAAVPSANNSFVQVVSTAGRYITAANAGASPSVYGTITNGLPLLDSSVDETTGFANAGSAYLNVMARDAYKLPLAGSAYYYGLSCTGDVYVNGGASNTGFVAGATGDFIEQFSLTQGSATNAPITTTCTASVNNVVVGTKSITFRGDLAKIEASLRTVGASNTAAGAGTAGTISFKLFDSAGNRLNASQGGLGAVSLTATGSPLVNNGSITVAATTDVSGRLSYNCVGAGKSGTVAVTLKATNASGATITSAAVNAACGGALDTYTASLDKAAYQTGDIATLTIKGLDINGKMVNDAEILGAACAITVTGMTAVTPVNCNDAFSGGEISYTWKVDNTSGNYVASVYLPVASTQTAAVTQKVTIGTQGVSNADVLKAIVSLIASINKQIAALQKALLKKK